MAVGYLTSSTLIDAIKRIGMIPATQSTFTDDDFLALANEEMRIALVPSVMQYHEEYFVVDSDPITLETNKNNYPIPYRAIGNKFRELFYQDTNEDLVSMSRISPDDRPYYQQNHLQGTYVYFYIRGNDVVITPDVSTNPVGSLVFSYYLRPNDLVSEDRVATITAISEDTDTTTYTVDQVPTGMNTTVMLDILQTKPGHKTRKFDINCTSVNSTNLTITFDNDDLPDDVEVGDYIAFAGECIIPQVPSDLHHVLAQRVAARCIQALGDQNGLQAANVRLTEMEIKTGFLVDNRSEGNPQKIVNLKGLLRSSKIGNNGGFF